MGLPIVKNPAHKAGLLLSFLKESQNKPPRIGGSRPQTLIFAIHPRAQHGAFWLFHESLRQNTPFQSPLIKPFVPLYRLYAIDLRYALFQDFLNAHFEGHL